MQHSKRNRSLTLLRNQAGMTIPELLIAFTLSLLLLGGVAYGANKFIQGNKAKRTIEELPVIFSGTQKAFGGATSYNGITLTTLINNRVFPDELVNGTSVNNRFGGTITVAAANLSGTNDGAAFTVSNLTKDGCVDIVQTMASTVATIKVDATNVKTLGGTLDIAATGTACSDTDSNSVIFTITK